jgi:hypothetical protein
MATTLALLAPTGTTGNNTHTGVGINGGADRIAVQFVVEAAGGTPTVTWKAQGSLDGANWYDLFYVTDSSDTGAASTRTATGTGAQTEFLDVAGGARFYNQYRLVTSANTNITYRGELWVVQRDE